jgi:hypothetical protein
VSLQGIQRVEKPALILPYGSTAVPSPVPSCRGSGIPSRQPSNEQPCPLRTRQLDAREGHGARSPKRDGPRTMRMRSRFCVLQIRSSTYPPNPTSNSNCTQTAGVIYTSTPHSRSRTVLSVRLTYSVRSELRINKPKIYSALWFHFGIH